MDARSAKVVLVQMPWATVTSPSLALGILKAICNEENISCVALYANLELASLLGQNAYATAATERALFGMLEHLFAVQVYGVRQLESELFLEGFATRCNISRFNDIGFLRSLRDAILPGFLARAADAVVSADPSTVGLTATFNQVMGGLALAALVKQRAPWIRVIAGGACYDGEMGHEYYRVVPQLLDHVFLGEADESFREFVRRLKDGRALHGIPGVVDSAACADTTSPKVANLDLTCVPDYSDFFSQMEELATRTGDAFEVEFLPFESARGCWWGEKQQCTFCGINRDLIAFRSKSPGRVIRELITLSARHNVLDFLATDWIIARRNRTEVLQRLAELDLDISIFYEVRTDMTKTELRLMRDAGVHRVQPGIESFSTPLLRLMKKHRSGLHQVQFLRWCRELGVKADYNLLGGFPGEDPAWYDEMIAIIPQVHHLDPPSYNLDVIELHRFSPLFVKRDAYGLGEMKVRSDYRSNFPSGMIDIAKVAYFFEHEAIEEAEQARHVISTRAAIQQWLDASTRSPRPRFDYSLGPRFMVLRDSRGNQTRTIHLEGFYHDIVLLSDTIMWRTGIVKDLSEKYPSEARSGALESAISELIADGILLSDGNRVLALPVALHSRPTDVLRAYVLEDVPFRDDPGCPT